jgi:hypothetical protein
LTTPLLLATNTHLDATNRLTQQKLIEIQHEIDVERRRMERDHLEAAEALQLILHRNQETAELISAEQRRLDSVAQEEEDIRARADKEKQTALKDEERQKEKDAQENAKRENLDSQRAAEKEEAVRSSKYEFIAKAKKLVAQLVLIRASVESFEKSKAVGKRRLQMKKVVNGKVNTLSENTQKIREVANDVSQAIEKARDEDKQAKEQGEEGNKGFLPEMARGKRYFVDLLSSKVIVRVQAEGFNG